METLKTVEDLLHLSPIRFQEMIMSLYKALGCEVEPRKIPGKYHLYVDITTRERKKSLAECRIGLQEISKEDVQSFIGLLKQEKASEGAIITMGEVSEKARATAKNKRIFLYDGNDFLSLWRNLHLSDTSPREAGAVTEAKPPQAVAPFTDDINEPIPEELNLPTEGQEGPEVQAETSQVDFLDQIQSEAQQDIKSQHTQAEIHRLFDAKPPVTLPPEVVRPALVEPAPIAADFDEPEPAELQDAAIETAPVEVAAPLAEASTFEPDLEPEPAILQPEAEFLSAEEIVQPEALERMEPAQAEISMPEPGEVSTPVEAQPTEEEGTPVPPEASLFLFEPEPVVEESDNVFERLFGKDVEQNAAPATAPLTPEPEETIDFSIFAIPGAGQKDTPVSDSLQDETQAAAESQPEESLAETFNPADLWVQAEPLESAPAAEEETAPVVSDWVYPEDSMPASQTPEAAEEPNSLFDPALVEQIAEPPLPEIEPPEPASAIVAETPPEAPVAEAVAPPEAVKAEMTLLPPEAAEAITASEPDQVELPDWLNLPELAGPAAQLPQEPLPVEKMIEPPAAVEGSQPVEPSISNQEPSEPLADEPAGEPQVPLEETQPAKTFAPIQEPVEPAPAQTEVDRPQPSEPAFVVLDLTASDKGASGSPDLENPAFCKAIERLEAGTPCLFVTGRAGTGKNALLNYFVESSAQNVVVLAPTTRGALRIEGQTIRSFFNFPNGTLSEKDIQAVSDPVQRALFQHIDTLVIDEIPLVEANLVDAMDLFLRLNGRHPDRPFGGVQVLLLGDLFHLVSARFENDLVDLLGENYPSPSFFDAHVFRQLPIELIELQKDYDKRNETLQSLLNSVRVNALDDEQYQLLNGRVDPAFVNPIEPAYIRLTSLDSQAAQINKENLKQVRSPECLHIAEVEGEFDPNAYPADKELILRRGAQVVFLQDDRDRRWIRGSLGKVASISESSIRVEITTDGLPFTFRVERETWENYRYKADPISGKIEKEMVGEFTQYPLCAGWAMPIQKSVGARFDHVIIDLSGEDGEPGQLYAALCTCKKLEGIVLKNKVSQKYKANAGNRIQEIAKLFG